MHLHNMVPMQGDELIGAAEATELLNIDRSTFTRWVQAGKVEPVYEMPGRNGARVFRRADIDKLVKAQTS